jgi:hypothetical protein
MPSRGPCLLEFVVLTAVDGHVVGLIQDFSVAMHVVGE